MKYRIANLIIESDAALSNDWAAFAWESETEGVTPELVAKVLHVAYDVTLELRARVSHPTLQHPQFSTTQVEDGWIYEYKADGGSVMQVDKDYTRVRLTEGEGSEYLLRLAVECRLIREGCISLHGACVIAPDGRAVIFTGNSGVGKSTRAAAWSTALNLKMISGDRPLIWTGAKCNTRSRCNTRSGLVLQADTACRAFGVPWDGKEGIHVNMNSPISVIFNVIRAKKDECEIRGLSSLEALRILMAQTFLPMWDTDLAAQAMGNLKTLIESGIKIADLVSGWDEAAALKAWETISPSLSGTAST